MLIEGVCGLGAEVAVADVEVKRTDSVLAVDTLENYSTFDPILGVVSHGLIVVLGSSRNDAPSVGSRT